MTLGTLGWWRSIGLGACALGLACGDDGMAMDTGTSSTGEAESSSSSSSTTADDTTGSSSEASSSSTGMTEYPPAMGWGDCQNIPEEFACLPEEVCVQFPTGSVCMRTGCESSFDCPAELETRATAPVVCGEVAASQRGLECYYLCTAMQTCPEGMVCDGDVCVFG